MAQLLESPLARKNERSVARKKYLLFGLLYLHTVNQSDSLSVQLNCLTVIKVTVWVSIKLLNSICHSVPVLIERSSAVFVLLLQSSDSLVKVAPLLSLFGYRISMLCCDGAEVGKALLIFQLPYGVTAWSTKWTSTAWTAWTIDLKL